MAISFYKYSRLVLSFVLIIGIVSNSYSQKYTEPDKLKQFNITVNHEDHTVKTQMLSQPKEIKINNERSYMWYGSQKIMETKGGYEGKLIHGNYTSFYLNNQLKEQGQIKYGLKNKEWKYWYPDGKLKEIINWKNGVKRGSYSIYNDYGQLMAKGNFKNDKLNGKFYTYGPTGKVTEKKVYKNGDEVIAKVKVEKPKKEKAPKEKKVREKKIKEQAPPTEKQKPKKEKKKKKTENTETEKVITS
ncbi:MAG: hypothetical protein H0W73_08585 [Bacteroidetes bacterium]|nr:hypothetical protein [Bacteroidota bacterium]